MKATFYNSFSKKKKTYTIPDTKGVDIIDTLKHFIENHKDLSTRDESYEIEVLGKRSKYFTVCVEICHYCGCHAEVWDSDKKYFDKKRKEIL